MNNSIVINLFDFEILIFDIDNYLPKLQYLFYQMTNHYKRRRSDTNGRISEQTIKSSYN